MRRKYLLPLGRAVWVGIPNESTPRIVMAYFWGNEERLATVGDSLGLSKATIPLEYCFFTEEGAWAFSVAHVKGEQA